MLLKEFAHLSAGILHDSEHLSYLIIFKYLIIPATRTILWTNEITNVAEKWGTTTVNQKWFIWP